MELSEGLLLAGLALLFLIMGLYYAKSERRFQKMLFGSLSGVAALYPASLAAGAAGMSLSMNLFNLTVAAILGIPGVVLLVAANWLLL